MCKNIIIIISIFYEIGVYVCFSYIRSVVKNLFVLFSFVTLVVVEPNNADIIIWDKFIIILIRISLNFVPGGLIDKNRYWFR